MELGRLLDESPRRLSSQTGNRAAGEHGYLRHMASSFSFKTPPSNRKGRIIGDVAAEEIRRRLGHYKGASVGSNAANSAQSGRDVSVPASAHRHRRKDSLASKADTSKSLPRRPSENVPRAASALGSHPVERSGNLTVLDPVPISTSSVSNQDENTPFGIAAGGGFAGRRVKPQSLASFEMRRPRWIRRPGWMRRDGSR